MNKTDIATVTVIGAPAIHDGKVIELEVTFSYGQAQCLECGWFAKASTERGVKQLTQRLEAHRCKPRGAE